MKENTHTYQSNEIEIRYDVNRCIHARECVKGLRSVFNPEQRPWIQPVQASADQIVDIVERCPTGALHYRRKDSSDEESPSQKNTISVVPDGPVYFRGQVEVRDHEGTVLLEDTRFALCRCGLSDNKPACDNSHYEEAFEATSWINRDALENGPAEYQSGKLVLKLMKNGPALVEGHYEIYSDTSQPHKSSKNIALCRCGASDNKPFCDGSHKDMGFES